MAENVENCRNMIAVADISSPNIPPNLGVSCEALLCISSDAPLGMLKQCPFLSLGLNFRN